MAVLNWLPLTQNCSPQHLQECRTRMAHGVADAGDDHATRYEHLGDALVHGAVRDGL